MSLWSSVLVGITCGAALHLYVRSQRDIGRAARLQRDGVGVEMTEHIADRLEPQVMDVALTVLIHRQSQMLQTRKTT